MSRLIVWDAPRSEVARLVKTRVREKKVSSSKLRFVSQNWGKTRLSVYITREDGSSRVTFPVALDPKHDRILIGPFLEAPEGSKRSPLRKEDLEYALGERLVLTTCIQYFLHSTHRELLLNPALFPGGSITIQSPSLQREILIQSGFSLPRAIVTNDSRSIVKNFGSYIQMEFLGMDIPTMEDSPYQPLGEPYLPRRLLKLGKRQQLSVVTVIADKVYEVPWIKDVDVHKRPRRVSLNSELYRMATNAAKIADTQVCEIIILRRGHTLLGLCMARTLGALNLPQSLPYLIDTLIRQYTS